MESLRIPATKSTPEIAFDPASGVLAMRGESYPENSFAFFRPIISWIADYLDSTESLVIFNANLSYLNTGSTKSLIDILDLLENAHKAGKKVEINWFYDVENDRALSNAEEFKDEVTLPFKIHAQASS